MMHAGTYIVQGKASYLTSSAISACNTQNGRQEPHGGRDEGEKDSVEVEQQQPHGASSCASPLGFRTIASASALTPLNSLLTN